ncbi:uncharacterized protein EDB91DRAFT_1055920 [Suillus paluster]|uniref:uncharacterized protein n=1 Tax=Suillus paluster TaxID=48578 RepID=UPI001B86BC63|nr:uncharacterized protein EDB91DRAFT_1055920 [Suillus paluster]KAG1735930.1 hypothetical protein EDB91DRAFT_1055920 [Suillus paluster]
MLDPSKERPTTLHIYNFGSVFGNRKIIKGEDKTTTLYFMQNTRSSLHWTFDLHADGPDGPLLCRAQSSYNGPPLMDEVNHGPTTLSMTAVRRTVKMERKLGAFDGTVFFKGPDQKEYRWQTTARLFRYLSRSSCQCLDAEDALIATYRITSMSVTKDGVLVVQPSGKSMLDLLVATSLAMRTPNN